MQTISNSYVKVYTKIFLYIESFAHSKYKLQALFVISFLEQSISPILPDLLIIPIAMYKKYSAFFVANFAAISSALGGIFAYYLFYIYGQNLLSYFGIYDNLEIFKNMYLGNLFLTTIIVGFTPIPDKIYTILGGVFKVNVFQLIMGLYIGKLIRFYLVAYLAEKYGLKAKDYLIKYIDKFTYVLMFLIFAYAIYIYIR